MKLLASLIALLFVTLSVAPCADVVPHEHEAEISHAEHHDHAGEHDHSDGHDHEGADDCSPLCYCHCCHTSVIISLQEFKWPSGQDNHYTMSTYAGTDSEPHFHSLFRPPIS